MKLPPCWLASIVPEGVLQAARKREKTSMAIQSWNLHTITLTYQAKCAYLYNSSMVITG